MKIALALSILITPVALASQVEIRGTDSSGGGKSVACRDPRTGSLLSVEMLDLFEARAMYGLEPLAMGKSVDEILATAKEKFTHTVFDGAMTIPPALDQLRKQLRIMPPGTHLEPVDDASPVVLPNGCKLEQAAVWVDSSTVVADHELWNAMDARNQVALLAHEVIYARTREEGETNSRRARKIVGFVFSQFSFRGTREGLPENPSVLCLAGSPNAKTYSEFWIYPDAQGRMVAQFEILHNAWLYDRTTGVFNNVPYQPSQQKISGMEAIDLESNFETRKFYALEFSTNASGVRVLSSQEYDDKGRWVDVPVSCTDQRNP